MAKIYLGSLLFLIACNSNNNHLNISLWQGVDSDSNYVEMYLHTFKDTVYTKIRHELVGGLPHFKIDRSRSNCLSERCDFKFSHDIAVGKLIRPGEVCILKLVDTLGSRIDFQNFDKNFEIRMMKFKGFEFYKIEDRFAIIIVCPIVILSLQVQDSASHRLEDRPSVHLWSLQNSITNYLFGMQIVHIKEEGKSR